MMMLHKTSLKGLRETNEDVEAYKLNLSAETRDNDFAHVDIFVICDGHGGSQVARYVAPNLLRLLGEKTNKYPLTDSKIVAVYNKIQRNLITDPNNNAYVCGCTALVVIVYINNFHKKMQVINLGDCRAVLCRNGLAIPLCKDHKPYWPDEKRRLDNVNRTCEEKRYIKFDDGDWRIGDLSVSRSFGDLDNMPHITHIPEIFDYDVTRNDEFIVMACDGLWDVLQNHDVVNFVKDFRTRNNINLYDIPELFNTLSFRETTNLALTLGTYAIASGSTDNVSVMIYFIDKL